MKLAILFVVLLFAAVAYALWIRPWMRGTSWGQAFLVKIEPVEIFLYKKSETIFIARTFQLLGVVLTFLNSIGQFDLSPFASLVPDRYQWIVAAWPIVFNAIGWMQERMRKDTTKPLEVVALPSDSSPTVLAAAKDAEVATAVAVQEIKIDAAATATAKAA